jgi:hypothetical protein
MIPSRAPRLPRSPGALGVRIKPSAPRDPESKGLIERRNGDFEASFLPGRTLTSPVDPARSQVGSGRVGV